MGPNVTNVDVLGIPAEIVPDALDMFLEVEIQHTKEDSNITVIQDLLVEVCHDEVRHDEVLLVEVEGIHVLMIITEVVQDLLKGKEAEILRKDETLHIDQLAKENLITIAKEYACYLLVFTRSPYRGKRDKEQEYNDDFM